ncbi:MAG: hypothetical protein Q4G27_02700 [Flavobacteriaceae bacterium]|nr:hypothetical protein [Flavobacteriaceae bacterium]
MKHSIPYLFSFILFLLACQNEKKAENTGEIEIQQQKSILDEITIPSNEIEKWSPNNHLTADEQENLKYNLVRYFEKLPKKATHQTKFNPEFDEYYKEKANEAHLLYLVKDADDQWKFVITKQAPSLQEKRVATAGTVKLDNNEITFYQENFRTWKMPNDQLENTMQKLFYEFIQGNNMEKYETRFTNPELIIEFPDEVNHFDTNLRQWSIEPKE